MKLFFGVNISKSVKLILMPRGHVDRRELQGLYGRKFYDNDNDNEKNFIAKQH